MGGKGRKQDLDVELRHNAASADSSAAPTGMALQSCDNSGNGAGLCVPTLVGLWMRTLRKEWSQGRWLPADDEIPEGDR